MSEKNGKHDEDAKHEHEDDSIHLQRLSYYFHDDLGTTEKPEMKTQFLDPVYAWDKKDAKQLHAIPP